MFLLRLVIRNAFRHRLRTALTIVGLAIAVLAYGLLQTVVDAWYAGAAAASSARLVTRNAISLAFFLPVSYESRIRSVQVKQHDIETSLLEGILTRGDRRVAPALEEAWRRGCRLDGWKECIKPDVWWQTFADLGIDVAWYTHRERPMSEVLPWDHVNVKKGREYLEKEQERSRIQLELMANAE